MTLGILELQINLIQKFFLKTIYIDGLKKSLDWNLKHSLITLIFDLISILILLVRDVN